MAIDTNLNRYSVIEDKNKREIVLLLGLGCRWRRCTFCDYHLDYDNSVDNCFKVNREVLTNVKGIYGKLEVINSGSFCELDAKTMDLIEAVAVDKQIKEVHFECHYAYRETTAACRQRFADKGIAVKMKCGVETFDDEYRERVFDKGMKGARVEEIARYFDAVCLLFGLAGQTEESMRRDIELGLVNFERVCVNIMQPNSKKLKPDTEVIKIFTENIYNEIKDNPRVDVLMNNTDFGVG